MLGKNAAKKRKKERKKLISLQNCGKNTWTTVVLRVGPSSEAPCADVWMTASSVSADASVVMSGVMNWASISAGSRPSTSISLLDVAGSAVLLTTGVEQGGLTSAFVGLCQSEFHEGDDENDELHRFTQQNNQSQRKTRNRKREREILKQSKKGNSKRVFQGSETIESRRIKATNRLYLHFHPPTNWHDRYRLFTTKLTDPPPHSGGKGGRREKKKKRKWQDKSTLKAYRKNNKTKKNNNYEWKRRKRGRRKKWIDRIKILVHIHHSFPFSSSSSLPSSPPNSLHPFPVLRPNPSRLPVSEPPHRRCSS